MGKPRKSILMPTEVSDEMGFFDRFAGIAASVASRAYFFAFCVLLIALWLPSFLLIRNLDTWQLIINTATTIITFNMVFVIQNTQNRDGRAIQAKLDAQAEVLAALANRLDVDDPELLIDLIGVEDAPEKVIKVEQDKVRQDAAS